MTGFVKGLQKKSPLWHAVFYNCNAFVGDIARFMGMETPASTMLMPADYIDSLRDLNISRVNVAGVIGTPVKVDDAAKLRAEALKALERSEKSASKVRDPSAGRTRSGRGVDRSRSEQERHAGFGEPDRNPRTKWRVISAGRACRPQATESALPRRRPA